MRRLLLAIPAVLGLAGLVAWVRHPGATAEGARIKFAPDLGPSRFARALSPRPILLPADHGPHFDYQTEWWYYTGNLQGEDGRHLGYQLTFFRRGLTPGPPPPGPGLATNQIYLAHLALSDTKAGTHTERERVSRGAAGLAGAAGAPFGVWLEDWRVEAENAEGSAVRLQARDGDVSLDLHLDALKPLVAYGDRGLSAKGDEPGNASYYVGYTRLRTRGRVTSGGTPLVVEGESWFDHEWSTSALDSQAVGWDWFSLQLDDGRELMLFAMRGKDGRALPASGGALVEDTGRVRRLGLGDFRIEVEDHWRSPQSGVLYPSRWRLTLASADLELQLEPYLKDQEMRTSFTYWEGAIRIAGSGGRVPVRGHGYAELTGYAHSMQGVF